jgi:signal transduction histidine kinase
MSLAPLQGQPRLPHIGLIGIYFSFAGVKIFEMTSGVRYFGLCFPISISSVMNVRKRILALLQKQTKPWLIAEGLLLVCAIGIPDYLTGYEVSLYPFYSIPILLVLWFGGKSPAFIISVASGLAWLWADDAAGHIYPEPWLRLWDFLVRLMFFYLVVMTGAAFRRQRDENQSRIRLLEYSQGLEHEIISISEQERQRIGRDIHDGLGQYLVAVGLAADSLKEELTKESPKGSKAVGKFAELLHDAVVRTRNVANDLSPFDHNEATLELALEHLASTVSRLSKIPCSFLCLTSANACENSRAVHLFRIAQEAVNNAVKHSHARSILITLDADERQLVLKVSDNGIGFDVNTPRSGMGLKIMSYRARMIGGALSISPNHPSGTIVACTIDPHSTTHNL